MQVPFVTVQVYSFAETLLSPVTKVVGEFTLSIVPAPPVTDQTPVPPKEEGSLPSIVSISEQTSEAEACA